MVDKLMEAFRTGIGYSFDDRGADAAASTEGLFRNWYRQVLVPTALPMLDGIAARLAAGGVVADVGCGSGLALVEMARAFPNSRFHGYDTSKHALERAVANRNAAGVNNIELHDPTVEPLPSDASVDLVTTFDCLHDMTHPEIAVAAIGKAIKPDGFWLIADINGAPTFEEQLGNAGLTPIKGGTPASYAKVIDEELALYEKLAAKARGTAAK